jgi:signal transduction histidine kinase/CheY-like chemotaxis protein
VAGEAPQVVPSNYGNYFEQGINNVVFSKKEIAITDYPSGVVFLDEESCQVTSLADRDSGLEIGDIYKVKPAGKDSFLAIGTGGVGRIYSPREGLYYSAARIFKDEAYRDATLLNGTLHLLTESRLVIADQAGARTMELSRTAYWIDNTGEGAVAFGALDDFNTLADGEIESGVLTKPIHDIYCIEGLKYASAPDGLHEITEGLSLDLVYKSEGKVDLLGESGGWLHVRESSGEILKFKKAEDGYRKELVKGKASGSLFATATSSAGIHISTDQGFFLLNGDRLVEVPLETNWQAVSLAANGDYCHAVLRNASTGAWALSSYSKSQAVMLGVPHLDKLGVPLDLLCDTNNLILIGTGGVGWYPLDELERVAVPRVSFDLLFEDQHIVDRVIPPGMHFIDLRVNFSGPEIPSLVQYRINGERWRNVTMENTSLPFAGHGSFTVELRAVHPNGNASPTKIVQFGIAPPWYLNPLYQLLLLVLAMLLAGFVTWGFFYLKSREEKRRRIWLEGEVKKATREVEASKAAHTNFLAGLSHDIRNPLNGVLMIAETLTRNPPKSTEDPRLKDLTEFGIIVDRMLGEILDFSVIDQKSISTSFIPVAVSDIIESSVKQNQFGIQNAMILTNTTIDPQLKELVIRTDRNWMIKVLSNLIINALEYSETDRLEISATSRNITHNEVDLEFCVSDWGRGIDDSEKPFIFDRFYRGESGIESGKHGTGLGLWICQEIAHAMGAHLELSDNEPSGCRFVLKGRFEIVEGARELDKDAVLETLRGKRVLVVDDLVYNRKSIVEFFQTIGCECDQAEGGLEGLDMLSSNRYHLALLDWDLPGLTGPEIARRHRRQAPDDPVILIAVTAYTDGKKKKESEEAGMNGYISKPLTATRLAYCLANIHDWRPEADKVSEVVDTDEVQEEIYKHIEDCVLHTERYEWEKLRRCAHRLTTLALIRNNSEMQQVCRDIQVAASDGNIEEVQLHILELQKWRNS